MKYVSYRFQGSIDILTPTSAAYSPTFCIFSIAHFCSSSAGARGYILPTGEGATIIVCPPTSANISAICLQ